MNCKREDYQARINRVFLYIEQHIVEEISLDTLAKVANFSSYHFHRFFCGMVGETVASYIRRLRIERAAQMLLHSNKRITDIAYESGYLNLESFTRAFRIYFGILPSEYRAKKSILKRKFQGANLKIKGGLMDVKIVHKPKRKVIFMRHVGPYEKCTVVWEKLCLWAGLRGFIKPGAQFLGLGYDEPQITAPDKIRYDACITIDGDVEVSDGVGMQEIPAGDYAIYTHKGPYDKLPSIYAALCGKWLLTSGRELRHAPSVEVYINDPKVTLPQDLLTEIQLPLI